MQRAAHPMKLSPIIVAWQCARSLLVCRGLAFAPHPPPARAAIVAAAIPSTPPSSSFESSARSWLEDGNDAPPASPPQSSPSPSQLSAAEEQTTTTTTTTTTTRTTTTSNPPSWTDRIVRSEKYETNQVKRVMDASTIQLERGGYVALEAVRGAGGTYRLPDCMDRSPSYKLKQLLPRGAAVRLVDSDDDPRSSATPRVWIVRDGDDVLINRELVRTGFAFVRRGARAPPAVVDDLIRLEDAAREGGLGIFKSCDAAGDGETTTDPDFVAEFEPLDFTTETRYGDDGGRTVVVPRRDDAPAPPPDPSAVPRPVRRVRGCADFRTYEEALGWYERYAPYYGDVAGLDGDGDGVPCPGLPHTTVAEKYRMKVPDGVKSRR